MGLKDQIVGNLKGKGKNKIKQLAMKYIIPYVVVPLLGIVILASAWAIVEEKIKDASDAVVKAFSGNSTQFEQPFDNTSDDPRVVISKDMIKEIKKNLRSESVDIDQTYLTDALLLRSLKAYYATEYPYIEGEYDDDMVKGCIYLKRGTTNTNMTYKSYPNFKEMLGAGKSKTDVDNAKKYFSVDNDGNIVIVTWSRSSTVVKTELEGEETTEEGEENNTYEISEYKIDQKSITRQYAMSYKLPILLGNMYSNEGFGLAVADLGINSKVELTILDNTTNTTTVTTETYKMNWRAKTKLTYKKNIPSSSYDWWNTSGAPILADNITTVDGRRSPLRRCNMDTRL